MNLISSIFVPLHTITMSSIYQRYSGNTSLIYGCICFASKVPMKIFAYDGTRVVCANKYELIQGKN